MNCENFSGHAGARRPRGAAEYLSLLTQTMLQPLLFVFVFGRVMTRSGMMPASTKGCWCRESWG